MNKRYPYYSLDLNDNLSIDEIKKGFFNNCFSFSSDYRDLPGPFVLQCIENNLVTINLIYQWIDEYILTDNEYFQTNKLGKCQGILAIYNCGISKSTIVKMYNLFLKEYEKNNVDSLQLSCFLFETKDHNLQNYDCDHLTYCGLIPYLKMYGLNDEYSTICKIYEDCINKLNEQELVCILKKMHEENPFFN